MLLDASTNYTLRVTQSVKDDVGTSFLPYSKTFTTGSGGVPPSEFKFNKTTVYPTASNEIGAPLSSLVIGSDNKLYAAALDGKLRR